MLILKRLICIFISFSAAFAHGQSNFTAELDCWREGSNFYKGLVEIDLDEGKMRWKQAQNSEAGPDGLSVYATTFEIIEDVLKGLEFYPRGWLKGLNRANKSFMLIRCFNLSWKKLSAVEG